MNDESLPQRLGLFEAIGFTSIGMMLLTYEGIITMVNSRAEEEFGYESGSLVGHHINDLVPDSIRGQHSSLIKQYIDGDMKPRSIGRGQTLTGKKQDNTEFPVVIGLSPVHSQTEKLILATIVDLTIPHEIEKKNKKLISELEVTKSELEGFSYSVSHDLRAPLRAIDGYTKILQEDYADSFDDEGKRVVGVVLRNVEKMGMLIDDVLRFSRLGRQHIKYSAIDMTTLAQSVFDEHSFDSSGRQVNFQLENLPEVQGDFAMIKQIWANLIENAIKYSAPREIAIIEVKGHIEGDMAFFSIQDNGVGFNMDYVEKVFEVFQRLHKEKDFKGTGVGLALVQRIIHRHGGQISAHSTEGEGSRFEFNLPLIQTETEAD